MCNGQSKSKARDPANYGSTKKERQQQAQLENIQLRLDVDELKKLHHSADYKCTTEFLAREYLVVRRCCPLKFNIESRNTDLTKMKLEEAWLVVSEDDKMKVEIEIETTSKFLLKARAILSATTPVGLYENLLISLIPAKEDSEFEEMTLSTKHSVFVAFNPWNKDELVFLEDEAERAEYVQNDRGVVWMSNLVPCPWFFAQHQESVLAVLSRIFKESEPTHEQLTNPIQVSRIIAKYLVDKILVGKWTGDYGHGKDPASWRTTPQILKEYLETSISVRYGQCWVFTAVLCSLLRGIGIPSRPVTNYNSAHDINTVTDTSDLQVDFFMDQNGNPIEEKNRDFLWNFHTWTELWLNRTDLSDSILNGKKVSLVGWQVIDSTPQESGRSILGPASLSAVKEGCIGIPFDTECIYGGVNADHVFYIKNLDGSFKEIFRDTNIVGRNISTKAVGKMDRSDITGLYKYREGSFEERERFQKAHSKSIAQELAVINQKVQIEFLAQDVIVGHEFVGHIEVSNNSPQLFQAMVLAKAFLVRHNGHIIKSIFEARHPWKKFHARDMVAMDFSLKPDKYMEYLHDQPFIMAYVYVQLKETNQKILSECSYHFVVNPPKVTVPDTVRAYEPFNLNFTFVNPLKTALHDVEIIGHGIKSSTQGFELVIGELAAEESVNEMHYLKFFKEGRYKMMITVYSKELPPSSCLADISVVSAVGLN
ncbi:Protein-glutamine gamma-glutamyltransferase K-like [Oopsacas minuta]|uniref:Protein-glutamine gamma-glutamyltransferase K-like n=1 Tax=Oopsacas minuta TaxID=111878 RepID=A0AAV7K727_9METZ|nr:Protein-glutamine gamma-glutamyltransferase K-like [Oopsacas minuta]